MVSFILPCYNIGRYIADCLDSIYGQGLTEDEFEVIAVNDCSTDETRSVIEEYASKHTNLYLINHTRNLTSGGARNTGIEAARGEFIWFVDPDDAIVENCLKGLLIRAEEKNADILFFNYDDCDEHLKLIRKDQTFHTSEILSGQEYVSQYFPRRLSTFGIIWRAIFKTEFLKGNGLRYPIMRKAQDVVFLWKCLLQANRVSSLSDVYYLYRNNPYSVMKHQLEAHVAFSDRVLRGYEISKMLTEAKVDILPVIHDNMAQAIRWCANFNLEVLSQMSNRERSNYYSEIIDNPEAVASLKPYMNKKSRLLFDTSFGKAYWLCKTGLLCRREKKRKG